MIELKEMIVDVFVLIGNDGNERIYCTQHSGKREKEIQGKAVKSTK